MALTLAASRASLKHFTTSNKAQLPAEMQSSGLVNSNGGQAKLLHLCGVDVKHSIAPSMHNFIAKSLKLPWTFQTTICPTFQHVIDLAYSQQTAGLVVTMPYKSEIMKHVDEPDELASTMKACNTLGFRRDGGRRLLCGSNTDWKGVVGSLLEKGDEATRPTSARPGAALIVGAGGASRAAIYALKKHLHCTTIFIINRDKQEAFDLIAECSAAYEGLEVVYIETLGEAEQAETPYYIVGTVPDIAPQLDSEKEMVKSMEEFLARSQKGVLLDMCFKPRRTRMIKLAESYDWPCVEGIYAIGHQVEEQWRLWVNERDLASLDREGAWKALLVAADESPTINF